MNPCNPSLKVNNARALARTKLTLPRSSVNTMSKKQVCNAFRKCKKSAGNFSLPPMRKYTDGDTIIYYGRNSPLKGKDYIELFANPSKEILIRLARKVGLIEINQNTRKQVLKAQIFETLIANDIPEPIEYQSKLLTDKFVST